MVVKSRVLIGCSQILSMHDVILNNYIFYKMNFMHNLVFVLFFYCLTIFTCLCFNGSHIIPFCYYELFCCQYKQSIVTTSFRIQKSEYDTILSPFIDLKFDFRKFSRLVISSFVGNQNLIVEFHSSLVLFNHYHDLPHCTLPNRRLRI